MLERTNQFRQSLRRFTFSTAGVCPKNPTWGHDATVHLGIETIETDLEGTIFECAHDDPRWPKVCAACGYSFTADDQWQSNTQRLHRTPSGELLRPQEADPGAMWFVPWYDGFYVPQLEHVLAVMLPNKIDWVVDSQANNCTMPDDRRQEKHHCWIISGTLPDITAGKGGVTCAAGAGSILAGNWHGFLRNGYLEEC